MDNLFRLILDVCNSTLEGKSYCYVINRISEILPQIIMESQNLTKEISYEDAYKGTMTRFLQNQDRSNLLQQELDVNLSDDLIKSFASMFVKNFTEANQKCRSSNA